MEYKKEAAEMHSPWIKVIYNQLYTHLYLMDPHYNRLVGFAYRFSYHGEVLLYIRFLRLVY